MQHRGLVVRANSVDHIHPCVSDVGRSIVPTRDIVREVYRVSRSVYDGRHEIHDDDPFAGRDAVHAQLGLTGAPPWNTGRSEFASEFATSRRFRGSSTSMPTDETRSESLTTVVTRPSLWIRKIEPSESDPVRTRPFVASHSTPSGMNPPRAVTIVAGGRSGVGADAAGSGAGGGRL